MRSSRSPIALVMVALVALATGCSRVGAESTPASPAAYAPPPIADGVPRGNAMGADGKKVDAPAEAPPPPPAPPPGSPATTVPEPKPAPKSPSQEERSTQLIIYTAQVTMAVYQVEQGLVAVEKIARDVGGYLAQRHDHDITIRVPRARFQGALASIDAIGDVLHRNIRAEDVTDEFVDIEIRINNARAMQARLRQLLERAAVKEALEIEKELARVTQDLELLEGRIKLLKDKIAFSTITVSFEARGTTIPSSHVRLPFPWVTQLGLPSLLNLEESK